MRDLSNELFKKKALFPTSNILSPLPYLYRVLEIFYLHLSLFSNY